MDTLDLRNKNILVIGMARTGISAANLLANFRANVFITDIKDKERLESAYVAIDKRIKVFVPGFPKAMIKDMDMLVVSPGVPLENEIISTAREIGIEAISEIELAYQLTKAPIIAITGTNGKSTTTTLIGDILTSAGKKVFVGGNLGFPLCNAVKEGGDYDFLVAEVSSFQLELVKTFKPYIAVVLNITPDHIDRHKDMETYIETKKKLVLNQTRDNYVILNKDDNLLNSLSQASKGESIFFSRSTKLNIGAYLEGRDIIVKYKDNKPIMISQDEVKLKGIHNMENIMAASIVSCICDVSEEALLTSVKGFNGLPHRMEFVREVNGVEFINDSKCTNIGALKMSLMGFNSPIILIAGGKDKSLDMPLLKEIVRDKVKSLILIGEAAHKIRSALTGICDMAISKDMADAVRYAYSLSRDGDVVLLSPACASFDMFNNFEERGDVFKKVVRGL